MPQRRGGFDEYDPGAGGNREGARGPYVGRGPKGYTRSDETICEDVCERLTRSGGVDASEIEVGVGDGEVTLNGWVDDRDQKRTAEDLADGAPGVRDVHNRIRIRRRPGAGTPETTR
jgi:osmotically-inducible protein OsmY